ncbi:hypothetical protein HK405_011968 [Cladochytrium tenue]|nr:hypothetical protein HK405_011968 [Cladochytrium tenue]
MTSAAVAAAFGHDTPAATVAAHFAARARGLRVLITGGNTGLGLETARVLALNGAHVTIAARSTDKGLAAIAKIKAAHPDAPAVSFLQLDLASLAAVDAFADKFLASGEDLNVLINNAGVMACPYAATPDGYESQFAVNHLAHFHLSNRLLPALERTARKPGAPPSRVVALASIANILFAPGEGINFDRLSGGAADYRAWTRYGESKLANILFAYELNKRLATASQPVVAVSLHPGVIYETELTRHSGGISSGIATVLQINKTRLIDGLRDGTKDIPQGAATSVLCALDPDLQAGKYYVDCHVSEKHHPLAFNDALAIRLWELSESMVKAALEKAKSK